MHDAFEVMGWLCGAFAALQFALGIWSWRELRRKSVPELWGLDWLNILCRLENAFAITFNQEDFSAIPADCRIHLTAGELSDLVAEKLRACERGDPQDRWEIVRASIAESLNIAFAQIEPESKLYADIGMNPDWP